MNKHNSIINTGKSNSLTNFLRMIFRDYLIIFTILILVIITIILQPSFLTLQNITNLISQLGSLSLVTLGMTIAIIGGFIDLSVPGIINLVAVVTVSLIQPLGQGPALLIGLCLGVLMGLINSFLIVSSGATTMYDALFITYGMSTVYSALALTISGGSTQQLRWIEGDTSIFQTIGSSTLWIFSVPVLIFIGSLVLLYIFQSRTYRGRMVSLVGGNKIAANLAGVPVNSTIMIIFMITGLMAALSGIVLFSRVTQASPVLGINYDLNSILAVVVGGTTLQGGRGSVLRTVLGILLVSLLSNCMNLLGISTYIQTILTGAVFVLAIWLDNRKERKGEYK